MLELAHVKIHPSVCLSIYPPIHPLWFFSLSTHPPTHSSNPSVYPSIALLSSLPVGGGFCALCIRMLIIIPRDLVAVRQQHCQTSPVSVSCKIVSHHFGSVNTELISQQLGRRGGRTFSPSERVSWWAPGKEVNSS